MTSNGDCAGLNLLLTLNPSHKQLPDRSTMRYPDEVGALGVRRLILAGLATHVLKNENRDMLVDVRDMVSGQNAGDECEKQPFLRM